MRGFASSASSTMAQQDKSDQEVSDRLVRAALADPAIFCPGFDASRVFALISVVLQSPSSPKKRLLRAIKTVYLFQVTNPSGQEAQWWLDMKKKGRVGVLKPGEKAPLKPDVIVRVQDRDLVGLVTGRLTPQKLYAAKVSLDLSLVSLVSLVVRLHIRGDLDRSFQALRILSQEREKLERLAGPEVKSSSSSEGVWAQYGGKDKEKSVSEKVGEKVSEGWETVKAKL
ncbi:SCP2 domain-containing protein [Rhodotorula toruloides]|nr:SCP2 domain-containing protein [Rhodotorula toruloides]